MDELMFKNEPLSKSYYLVTEGKDREIDVLGVCLAALGELKEGIEVARVLNYLAARFSK